MNLVAENDLVISYFSGNMTILSGTLTRLSICSEEDILIVELDLRLLYANSNHSFKLRLIDVSEYGFFHTSDYIFYNIENIKFFKSEGLYYLSLDPDGEHSLISKNDNDFILSKRIEAYSLTSLE